MALSIWDGVNSRRAQFSLGESLKAAFKSMEKLASGLRINSAADDPAGLVISEQLRSRIGSLNSEIDGISATIHKYSAVSGALTGLREQLTELRSLAVGAANAGGNSDAAQQAYQNAAQDIVAQYNQTIEDAEYNGQATLNGSEYALAELTSLSGIDLSSPEVAARSISRIDEAADELDEVQVDLGASQRYDLESQLRSLQVERQNLTAAESQIRDVDFGQQYAQFVADMIRTQAAASMLAHATLSSTSVVSLLNK